MKKSLTQILSGLTHLPDRSPEMAFDTQAETGTEEVKLEKVSGTVFDQQLSRPRKGCKG